MNPFTLKPIDFDIWVSTRSCAIVAATTSGFDYYDVLGINETASKVRRRFARHTRIKQCVGTG